MPALSASRLKNFLDCSWLFYQTYVEKVPEGRTHPKTLQGSLVHLILECLANPRHRKTLDFVMRERTVYEHAGLRRLIRAFRWRYPDLSDKIIADLDKLVFVALDYDFLCANAKQVLPPEHAFHIDFGDFAIKGFMDRVVIHDNVAIIRDYKSASATGVKSLHDDVNLQSLFYQTAVKHQLGLPSTVEFILLRFPPTKKEPDRHLVRIAPFTDAQLGGFRYYLAYLNQEVNALTVETAKRNYKADKDPGFCDYVCQLKRPFNYQCVLKDGKPVRGALIEDEVTLAEGETLEVRRYHGCAYFYAQPDLT